MMNSENKSGFPWTNQFPWRSEAWAGSLFPEVYTAGTGLGSSNLHAQQRNGPFLAGDPVGGFGDNTPVIRQASGEDSRPVFVAQRRQQDQTPRSNAGQKAPPKKSTKQEILEELLGLRDKRTARERLIDALMSQATSTAPTGWGGVGLRALLGLIVGWQARKLEEGRGQGTGQNNGKSDADQDSQAPADGTGGGSGEGSGTKQYRVAQLFEDDFEDDDENLSIRRQWV